MADVAVLAPASGAVPRDYTVPGAQEILPKAVSAQMDGSAAGSPWFPCLQVLDPGGHVMFTAIAGAAIAAGASADVSWFPGVKQATTGTGGSGIQFDTDPQSGDWLVVTTTGANGATGDGVRFTDTGFGGIEFRTTGFSADGGGVYMQSDSNSNASQSNALQVRSNEQGSTTTSAIRADGVNNTGTGTTFGIICNADGNGTGGATGLSAQSDVSTNGSGAASIAIDTNASFSGGTGNEDAIGIRTNAGARGAGSTYGAQLVASGPNGVTGDAIGARITAKALVGFAGTLYGMQVFIGTTKVFQINSDGSLHGLTGKTLTFDL